MSSKLVTATLVASALTPGEPGWLAVEYAIKDGWHIYWENPGETGIPTEVTLTLPDGVTASAIRYPGPHSFMMPGDLINYGYAHSATLLIPVEAEQWGGVVEAETRWLVCRDEQCVPGRASLSLSLSEATPTDLAARVAALPAPLPETAEVSRSDSQLSLTFPGAREVEVFPDTALEAALKEKPSASGVTARMSLKAAPAPGAAAVVRVVDGEGVERFYRVPFSG